MGGGKTVANYKYNGGKATYSDYSIKSHKRNANRQNDFLNFYDMNDMEE